MADGKHRISGMTIWRCEPCGQDFPHEAAYREHLKTAMCNYKGIDLNRDPFWDRSDRFLDGVKVVPPATSEIINQKMQEAYEKLVKATYTPNRYFKEILDGSALRPRQGLVVDDPMFVRDKDSPGLITTEASILGRIEDIERKAQFAIEEMGSKIRGMQHALDSAHKEIEALKKRHSFDASRLRGMPERIDYGTFFSDDEDGLEEGYRGWPIPKDKVIF